MHTLKCIRSVAIFSSLAMLCIVLMTFESQPGRNSPGHWTVFAFFCVGMIGFQTYYAMKSIHKRLSDLENRHPEDTSDTNQT